MATRPVEPGKQVESGRRETTSSTSGDSFPELATLVQISEAVTTSVNLKAPLHRILEILEDRHDVSRSAITLLQDETGELRIEAAAGLSHVGRSASYRVGEGITGRVVESGKPIVVPQISREPLFLKRADKRSELSQYELSFFCVPVAVGRHIIGALSVDVLFESGRDYQRMLQFLDVVAGMIGQVVKTWRALQTERKRFQAENTNLREELHERYDFPNIVGTSSEMKDVYEQVNRVARTNTTALIRGESGTGKELVAHAIHYHSLRAKKPFVKVNCAALPETLVESELFGYEKGAFTGAQSRKQGRFELADGGTLFLDEIGELDPGTQVKLLRVLQQQEFERLGGLETIKVNVRLIVATNKDLEQAMRDGTFREDLYYRLNVFAIFMPPLRERTPDIPLLADHFLEKYSSQQAHSIKRISTPTIDMLMSYHWPGNVRELENAIERAVLICDSHVIHGHHLPPTLQTAEASDTVSNMSLKKSVEAYEKDLIQDALKTTRGNRARAAKLLDTTERIIGYKVSKYRIDCSHFRR